MLVILKQIIVADKVISLFIYFADSFQNTVIRAIFEELQLLGQSLNM